MIAQQNTYIHEVEQGSQEWLELRAGRIGGTSCATLLVSGKHSSGLGAGARTLVYKKAAEKITGPQEGYINAAMQRGIDLEPVARRRYEDELFQTVTEVGYISKGEFLGVSPDGLVGEDGGIEIKCPGADEYVRFFDTKVIKPEYFYQCQWAMYLTGRKWWDFIYFHPEFAPADIDIQRQFPHEQTFKVWDKKVPAYIAEVERLLKSIANAKND